MVRASDICLEGPGFNPQPGHLFCLTQISLDDAKIKVKYVPTEDNVAHIFTKLLAKPKFTRFVAMLGLRQLNE